MADVRAVLPSEVFLIDQIIARKLLPRQLVRFFFGGMMQGESTT
jgi:hypothetical protein